MQNNGTYTGEILVGEVDFVMNRKAMDWQLKSERMTDFISLMLTDERGKRSIIELALPQNVPGNQFKKGEYWAIAIRTYWSIKSNQMRREARADMPPFQWNADAA